MLIYSCTEGLASTGVVIAIDVAFSRSAYHLHYVKYRYQSFLTACLRALGYGNDRKRGLSLRR
jgi:hypothetical protein